MRLFDQLFGQVLPDIADERLLLRLPRADDYPQWRDLRAESRAFLAPWEPAWSGDELSRPAYRARLKRYRQEAVERSGYTFFLFDAKGGMLLGGATVGQIRRGVAQSCTLGYWMGERYAGRGLMRGAVELIKPFVFEVERLHRIEAACLPTNARSIALLQRCGFRYEGHLRKYLKIDGRWEDHNLYALLAEDGGARPAPGRLHSAAAG